MTSGEDQIAELLERDRPTPEPAYRGALGRRLWAGWLPPSRPDSLWRWVAVFAVLGLLLLLVAALQI